MLIDDIREDLEAFSTRRLKKTLQKCKIWTRYKQEIHGRGIRKAHDH